MRTRASLFAALVLAVCGCGPRAAKGPTLELTYRVGPEAIEAATLVLRERLAAVSWAVRVDGDLVVSLPLSAVTHGASGLALARPLAEGDITVELQASPAADALPSRAAQVLVGEEVVGYQIRKGAVLHGGRRGEWGTAVSAHPAGTVVKPLDLTYARSLVEASGDLRFLLAADESDLAPLGTDLETETSRLRAWLARFPTDDLEAFNLLDRESGGPPEGLEWHSRSGSGALVERVAAFRTPREEWRFGIEDLAEVRPDKDERGFPAVHFRFKEDRARAFSQFTREHVGRLMGIVLDGEVLTLAMIADELPGEALISGGAEGFSEDEVGYLIAVLRSPPLFTRPELVRVQLVSAP